MNKTMAAALQAPKLFDLSGRTAIVTGAAGGLGKGIALALTAAGAKVVLVDLDHARLEALSGMIQAQFGQAATVFALDITDEAQVAAMAQNLVRDNGGIDILVNCAGVAVLGPTLEMSLDAWRRGMRINLEGTFICCREIGRVMVAQRRGKIVNISSVRGSQGRSGYASYAPSKAGVNLLTKSLACEWAEFGVNVNALAPIFIRTEMNAHILDDPEKGPEILRRIPLGRLGTPADLFGAVIYLSSAASDFVTGTVLYVDGGWTAA